MIGPYATRIVLIAVVAAPLGMVCYRIGVAATPRSPGLQRIGEVLLQQKDRALGIWPLNRYAALLAAGRLGAGATLLGTLILAKSLASLILGPIAAAWLPPACLTIPPLGFAFARARGQDAAEWSRWMAKQTGLQLASHLAAAAVGASAWWGTFQGGGWPWRVMMESPVITAGFLGFSVVAAGLAGWYEAYGHRRYSLVSPTE